MQTVVLLIYRTGEYNHCTAVVLSHTPRECAGFMSTNHLWRTTQAELQLSQLHLMVFVTVPCTSLKLVSVSCVEGGTHLPGTVTHRGTVGCQALLGDTHLRLGRTDYTEEN